MGGGAGHPAKLKAPYPTQAEMEQAIGPADFAQTEKWDSPSQDASETQTLYWWEKDSTWSVPTAKGKKPGFREIIIAHLDALGRLRVLEILEVVGFETIGRDSSEWRWIG
jgi:hypothetical protein